VGKILAYCLISLACFVSTELAKAQTTNRFSDFLSGSEIQTQLPEELRTGKHIVYFGANWCIWCPAQKASLKTLEKKCEVTYYDAEKDVEIYNYLRDDEKRIPLTIILIDGKIKRRFVGVHPPIRIRKAVENRSFKEEKSRLSILLRGADVPIWLGKYANLWTCSYIVYFGNKNCSACPQQRAILKGLEKEGFRIRYYDAHNDQALYDYLRKDEERVPLIIIFVEGKIKKTFVGVTSSLWIRPHAKKYQCDKDCDKCKDVNS
jgi:thiol-disulfide isomerase/thioredoxin